MTLDFDAEICIVLDAPRVLWFNLDILIGSFLPIQLVIYVNTSLLCLSIHRSRESPRSRSEINPSSLPFARAERGDSFVKQKLYITLH